MKEERKIRASACGFLFSNQRDFHLSHQLTNHRLPSQSNVRDYYD